MTDCFGGEQEGLGFVQYFHELRLNLHFSCTTILHTASGELALFSFIFLTALRALGLKHASVPTSPNVPPETCAPRGDSFHGDSRGAPEGC